MEGGKEHDLSGTRERRTRIQRPGPYDRDIRRRDGYNSRGPNRGAWNGPANAYVGRGDRRNPGGRQTIEEVARRDQLLTFEQFRRRIEPAGDDAAQQQAYREYVRVHQLAYLERFFSMHYKGPWFKERFHPVQRQAREESVKKTREAALERFKADVADGRVESIDLVLRDDVRLLGSPSGDVRFPHDYDAFWSISADTSMPASIAAALNQRHPNLVELVDVSPILSRNEIVEAIAAATPHMLALELSDPDSERHFLMQGWVILSESADANVVASSIDGRIIGGEALHAVAKTGPSTSVRCGPAELGLAERLRRHFTLAKDLTMTLDAEHDIASPLGDTVFAVEPAAASLEQVRKCLDSMISYLRRVHLYCFYCAVECESEEELASRCGHIHMRADCGEANEPSLSEDAPATLSSENILIDITRKEDQVESRAVRIIGPVYGPITEDSALAEYIEKVEEGRFRCVHCMKLFKGTEFVAKHLLLKHPEVSEPAIKDLAYKNAFLARPWAYALPHYMKPARPAPAQLLHGRAFAERGRQGERYSSTLHHDVPLDNMGGQRRRSLRQYIDLDTPAAGEVEISYD